jgi:hypothetical protein
MAGDKKSVQHLACTSPVLDCSLWEFRNLFPTFDLKRLLLHIHRNVPLGVQRKKRQNDPKNPTALRA